MLMKNQGYDELKVIGPVFEGFKAKIFNLIKALTLIVLLEDQSMFQSIIFQGFRVYNVLLSWQQSYKMNLQYNEARIFL